MAVLLDVDGEFNNDLDVVRYNDWLVTMPKTKIVTADLGKSSLPKSVNRDIPQGGVISPLAIVNWILIYLDNKGFKVIAYMDILSDIMSTVLHLLSSWATAYGQEVNPAKTELALFSTKAKILS